MEKIVYSRFNCPKTKGIKDFPKTIDVYTECIDENGKTTLKNTGETNFYEKIQTYKNETQIYNLLDRFQHGDLNALNKNHNAIYGDFTQMPTTIQEAHELIKKAEDEFKKLPIEIKKEFNNNSNEFLAAAQNGTIQQKFDKALNIDREKDKEIEILRKKLEEVIPGQTNLTEGIKYES